MLQLTLRRMTAKSKMAGAAKGSTRRLSPRDIAAERTRVRFANGFEEYFRGSILLTFYPSFIPESQYAGDEKLRSFNNCVTIT